MRLRLLLGCACAALVGAAPASGAPGLYVGVADNSVMWTTKPGPIVAVQRDLGLSAVRLSVDWDKGQWSLTRRQIIELNRAVSGSRGLRIVMSISGAGKDTPLDTLARDQFCGFAFSVLARYPTVSDVKVWNEPNTSHFWRPQFDADGASAAPAAYAELLVRCYDLLHTLRPGINVIGGSTTSHGADNPAGKSPTHSPARFIRELGAAYRERGRQRRLFDTWGHHPYPDTSAEPPSKQHAGKTIGQGDYGKLAGALTDAFRGTTQPVPGQRGVTIWYLEDGFQTSVPADKTRFYTGRENDANAIAPEQHADQLGEAVRLAYCQPHVGAFFNFELEDDASLPGWQSGVLFADWTPKPSYWALKTAIAEVQARTVDCSRFPPQGLRASARR